MQGQIKDSLLPEIFKRILAERMSGKLRISSGPLEKSLFFTNGRITFATSNQPNERIGEILVRDGTISTHDKDMAQNYRMPGKKFGDTLVEMGKLLPDDLKKALSKQAATIATSVFLLQDGHYYFSDGVKAPQEIQLHNLSTSDIIMEGIRSMPYRDEMKASIGNPARPLKLTAASYQISEQVTLKPTEAFVLSRIDGIASLAEIAPLVPTEEVETYKMVYGLRVLGLLIGSAQHQTAADAVRETKSQGSGQNAQPGVGANLHEEDQPAELATVYSRIGEVDYYQLLGVPSNASTADIKKMYYRMAKVYHPDRFRASGGSETQKKAAFVFSKMTEAYEVLVDGKARLAYDRTGPGEKRDFVKPPEERREEKMAEKESTEKGAQESYEKGLDLFNSRKYTEAIEPLSLAVKAAPRNLDYLLTLAKAQAKNPPSRKEAEKSFLRAVNLDKLNPEPYVQMGKYYKEIKDFEKALALFQRALAIDDEHEEAQKEMSSLPGQQGEKKSFWSRMTGK